MNKPEIIETTAPITPLEQTAAAAAKPAYLVLAGASLCHFLNDLIQSLLPSIYPILKENYALDFTQIGMITLAFQVTASLLQPSVGFVTDRKPMPFSLVAGMTATLIGLILLSSAHSYALILLAAGLVGVGSGIFHPESARVARLASGGRHGFAQSMFQVGGNAGGALGPLLAAAIIVPYGQGSIAWFSAAAALAIAVMLYIVRWYRPRAVARKDMERPAAAGSALPQKRVAFAISVLVMLMLSKQVYLASISSYLTFYLIDRFGVSTQVAQLHLFAFLAAGALGIVLGGRFSDRFSRKYVIWISILGVLPFTLALPYVDQFWTLILSMIIGAMLSMASPTIVVYGQELMPRSIGAASGMFYGLAFGIGGLGAALLGRVADLTSISYVYTLCSFLPLLGLVAVFLPDTGKPKQT